MKACYEIWGKKLNTSPDTGVTKISKIRLKEIKWDVVLQSNRLSDPFSDAPLNVKAGLYKDDQMD